MLRGSQAGPQRLAGTLRMRRARGCSAQIGRARMVDQPEPRLAARSRAVTLRAVAPSIFVPALVYEIGNGAIAPIVALTALDLGASPSRAGFMLALLGIGQVLGDIPSSSLAERIGDRHAMIVAAGCDVAALFGCLVARSLWVFGVALLVVGMSNGTFYLARQSYLTDVMPAGMRARAMSTLGGSHRIGLFVGPLVGASVIGLTNMRGAYVVAMITATATAALLIAIPDVPVPISDDVALPVSNGATQVSRAGVSGYRMFRTYRRLFATLGVAVLAVGAVRAVRQTAVPLWAEHIGLGPEQTSIIFGIASAVDMALFYPAGKVMDHLGRLAIAVPSMVILGVATMLLPLASGPLALAVFAIAMSFGNGLGSGIMMTLGADVAPANSRIRFLSVWRVMSDAGNAAGPLVVSIVASALTLAAGIAATGFIGVLAAVGLARWAPKYSAYATRKMVRDQRDNEVIA